MTTKLENREADYFKQLVSGMTEDQIRDSIKAAADEHVQDGYLRAEYAEGFITDCLDDLAEAVKLFAAMKPLSTPEVYAVHVWGYDQSNYENVTILGQAGSSMIGLVGYNVVAIAKNKYTTRTFAKLDEVRSTSWEPAISDDTILNNSCYQR